MTQPAAGVQHQRTILHVSNHPLVDAHLILEFDAAHDGKLFVCHDALPHQSRDEGDGEKAGAGYRNRHELAGIPSEHQKAIGLLQKDCKRRRCGVEDDQPALPYQAGCRQYDQHHERQATAVSATRVHQQRERKNVGKYLERQAKVEMTESRPASQVIQNRKRPVGRCHEA